jgi:hypothetical protein
VRGALVVLLLQVPLVHDHDETAPALPGERRDLEILIVEALDGIDQQHADVRSIDRAARPKG